MEPFDYVIVTKVDNGFLLEVYNSGKNVALLVAPTAKDVVEQFTNLMK